MTVLDVVTMQPVAGGDPQRSDETGGFSVAVDPGLFPVCPVAPPLSPM